MSQPFRFAINGFGRIGRKIARLALLDERFELVGINDLGEVDQLAHLLKYDSVHREFPRDVSVKEGGIQVGSKFIPCFAEKDPAKLPWKKLGSPIVHECTGRFTDRAGCAPHFEAGARKVIISAPAKDPDLTVCMGVNEDQIDVSKHTLLSNASCTTNCLAPLLKVLDENFGVKRGTMLTVHSYTNDQRILDLPHKDPRRARAAALSMIPTSTGAAKSVGLVIPKLKGKIDGISIRVPTPNVSVVDFSGEVEKSTTKDAINQAFEKAASSKMKGILAVSKAPLVSSDFNGNLMSSSIDTDLTMVLDGTFVKVISWYDNESGFSQRMLDLTAFLYSRS